MIDVVTSFKLIIKYHPNYKTLTLVQFLVFNKYHWYCAVSPNRFFSTPLQLTWLPTKFVCQYNN